MNYERQCPEKLTHTDKLLDQSSYMYNPASHKAMTIKTLTRQAQLVCGTPNSLRDENNYMYNNDFIKRNIYRPSKADEMKRNHTPVTTVTIPYIKGAHLKPSHGSYSPTTSV